MSPKHEFMVRNSVVKDNIAENQLVITEVDDFIILYIKDSLKWVLTYWNKNESEKSGLNYYGVTIFKENSIKHLRAIIICWIDLFNEAPEEFLLTGGYLLNEKQYEKRTLCKTDILYQLEKLVDVCNQSIDQGNLLLHKGI